jgi:starch phosphorylase
MDILKRLRELAANLYWSWHPEVSDLFRDLDSELWSRVNHNPVAFLQEVDPSRLEMARPLALQARITHAFHGLRDFLSEEDSWGARYRGRLRNAPAAYFSAEFGLHESLPIYSGGLGTLAGDHLKAASDLDVPLIGVGMLYAKGYFTQSLDETGGSRSPI